MKKKILVAEDDQSIVEVVKIILEDKGYSVIMVDQGAKVYKAIEQHAPGMIFLDIWLLGEDGVEIAKTLKANTHTKKIPLIMMSANNETEKITRKVGADDFLLKPFDIEDLLHLVKKHIKS